MFNQMSLFSLLKNTSAEPLVHPTCLLLDQNEARWLATHEIDRTHIKWMATVSWKELGCDVLVATTVNSAEMHYKPSLETPETYEPYHNIAYLKSHLQKCIRRSNHYKAIKTATHFYMLDLTELLRRLAIIAIEDALPLQGFSTLVWMTAAVSNGFNLSMQHFCWILGYVHDLCKCPYYEQLPPVSDINLKSLRLRSLCTQGRNLCYSIMFRQAYGGMKGDKNMMFSAASLWSVRFKVQSEFIKLLSRPAIFITSPLDPLDRSEWIGAAIDFHCYPGILNNLSEKHDDYTPEDIKEAIWHCSSSITNKANIADDLKQRDVVNPRYSMVWQVIKKDFSSLSKFMINRNA